MSDLDLKPIIILKLPASIKNNVLEPDIPDTWYSEIKYSQGVYDTGNNICYAVVIPLNYADMMTRMQTDGLAALQISDIPERFQPEVQAIITAINTPPSAQINQTGFGK
jgi:hypothetical protein